MDTHWMQCCFDLALKAKGKTSPNPLVGSVVVKEGRIIGRGYHPQAGKPHAEVFALRDCKEDPQGATLYVNLEPCCHYGKTPPCTEQIISAGIAKVVIAMEDPNPLVSGKGISRLKEAGIQVITGVSQLQARALNEVFIKYITTKRPFVMWKVAASLDGKVAVECGDAKWVTNSEARRAVHQTRAEMDAIMVGSNTVITDNPDLSARPLPEGYTQPIRVVLDGRGRVPEDSRLFHSPGGMVYWVVGKDARVVSPHRQVEIIKSPNKQIRLSWLLEFLGSRKITSVLLEGGPQLAASFWQAQLLDKVQWYIAPKLVGAEGYSALGNLQLGRMQDALSLENTTVYPVGDNWCLEGYPPWVASEV